MRPALRSTQIGSATVIDTGRENHEAASKFFGQKIFRLDIHQRGSHERHRCVRRAKLGGASPTYQLQFQPANSLHNRHCEPTGRANARPMTGSAKQSIERQERMDCFVACAPLRKRFAFVAGNDVQICVRDLAACFARVLSSTSRPLNSEGAGNAGRSARPQPRVQWSKAHALVTTVAPETSGIPRAMVLRLISRSPQ